MSLLTGITNATPFDRGTSAVARPSQPGNRPAAQLIRGAIGIVLWLALWEWATRWGPMSDTVGIPTASATLETAARLGADSTFWGAVGRSVLVATIALTASAVLGIGLGVAMGSWKTIEMLLEPTVQFLRAVPPVVVLPLILLVVGPTDTLAVILATIGGLWPILTQSQVGVRAVDGVAVDTARAMALPWRTIQTCVVLPSALPFIATGVRIAASLALMLSIGAGILGGSPGLGQAILTAQQAGDPEVVFGMLLWAGLLGMALNFAVSGVESRMTRGRRPAATS